MPRVDVVVSCPVADSFRVRQVSGMFDVPLAERSTERFSVELPDLRGERGWRIGLILGQSGSGKTSLARQLFASEFVRATDEQLQWPADRAVVDGFGERPIKQITNLLTAVGFGSPPAWVRPYRVLSGGEQFRADLARALGRAMAEDAHQPSVGECAPIVVCDEFTSTVDRQVGRFSAAAVARALRSGTIACRLVAVTCHYDVAEWLEPDWTIDMSTRTFDRRRLRRPPIRLEVYRAHRSAWRLFARHHYLSGQLNSRAQCYLAIWNGEPVAFCATLAVMGHRQRRRISRLVTLPDYQGVGLGTRLAEAVAAWHVSQGLRTSITASHPALIAHCRRSPLWRVSRLYKTGSRPGALRNYRGSPGRAVVSFEFAGKGESASESNDYGA